MARQTWQDAVADIELATSLTTTRQHQLASVAGISLPDEMPQLVAAARLQTALGNDIGTEGTFEIHDTQWQLMEALQTTEFRITTPAQNRAEARSWIAYLYLRRRQKALRRLELNAGDVVGYPDVDSAFEVSSIGTDGRVYFKGSRTGSAWPDKLVVRARSDDRGDTAQTLRRNAANLASLMGTTHELSMAKLHDLRRWEVQGQLGIDAIDELAAIIETADDERPIQVYLEAHPELLGALLGGRDRFVIPRPSFGGKYEPDFLIADTDSMGIRWLLVELETPASSVTLSTQNALEKNARRGVTQIQEWREWLQNNLDGARRSLNRDGLGLADIRPNSEGLVLVGRRHALRGNGAAVRSAFAEQNSIRIHTYDWLVESLREIINFVGPSGLNPHVIRPPR
ncbi:MAG TPA: Shedu anti-phage system protein SduA domain-containing protein [Mesorhizobium sp.]